MRVLYKKNNKKTIFIPVSVLFISFFELYATEYIASMIPDA